MSVSSYTDGSSPLYATDFSNIWPATSDPNGATATTDASAAATTPADTSSGSTFDFSSMLSNLRSIAGETAVTVKSLQSDVQIASTPTPAANPPRNLFQNASTSAGAFMSSGKGTMVLLGLGAVALFLMLRK